MYLYPIVSQLQSQRLTMTKSFILLLFFLVFKDGFSFSTKPFAPGVERRPGVYLEKWSGIDTFELEKLLHNPRFPYLPTWRGYAGSFHQIENWGENFGTRIRGYFVPKESGEYTFYVSSNGASQLFFSRDADPEHKSLIAKVTGLLYTKPKQYDKYEDQKSFPVLLEKGHYYFIETLMKEFLGSDHLSVAVSIPSGKFIAPITKEYLWTALPSFHEQHNATSSLHILEIAARAGARAGAAAGTYSAMKAGAYAGSKAGAKAGSAMGAEAGAMAAADAARETIKKDFKTRLMKLYRYDHHVVHLHLLGPGGKVHVENIGVGGVHGHGGGDPGHGSVDPSAGVSAAGGSTAAGAGASAGSSAGAAVGAAAGAAAGGAGASSSGSGSSGTSSATGSSATGSSATGSSATGTSAAGTSATGSSATGSSATGSSATGSSAAAGSTSTKAAALTAKMNSATVSSASDIVAIGKENKNLEETSLHSNISTKPASKQGAIFLYRTPAGKDPGDVARSLVYSQGPASKIVFDTYYTIHSLNLPAIQVNMSDNLCFKSLQSHVTVQPTCHYFIAREAKGDDARTPFMLESACVSGYFLTQRNYRYQLMRNDGTHRFNHESIFFPYKTIKFPSEFMLATSHTAWFVCESKNEDVHGTDIILDFPSPLGNYLTRCSFLFMPMPKGANPKMNCKNVLAPLNTEIPGQHRGKKTHEEKHSISPKCVAINFINNAKMPFKLFSSLKHHGYLVTGERFRLKAIIKRPDLHHQVVFNAQDPSGNNSIFIEGDRSITVTPSHECEKYIPVEVTAVPAESTPQKLVTPKPAVHYHYHYHNATSASCPPTCQAAPTCPPSCPQPCCSSPTTAAPAISHQPAPTAPAISHQPAPVVIPGTVTVPQVVHQQTAPCPSTCSSDNTCPQACPQHCCSRDVVYVSAKSTIIHKPKACHCERKCRNVTKNRRVLCLVKCERSCGHGNRRTWRDKSRQHMLKTHKKSERKFQVVN